MHHTLYIDESGPLAPTQRGQPLGLRMVGGVLLRGTREEHEQALQPHLAAAFEGWAGQWHAVELNHPGIVLGHVLTAGLAAADLPASLLLGTDVATRDRRWLELNPTLASALEGVCASWVRRVGRVLERSRDAFHDTCVIASIEHDLHRTTGRFPRTPAMLGACVERALWQLLAVHAEHSFVLDVVLEEGPMDATLDAGPLIERWQRARSRLGSPPTKLHIMPVRSVAKRQRAAGLVLADFALYALGAGLTRLIDLSAGHDAWHYGGGEPERRLHRRLEARVPAYVTDALETQDVLRAVLDGRVTSQKAEQTLADLLASPAALPAGVLRASVAHGRELVGSWHGAGL